MEMGWGLCCVLCVVCMLGIGIVMREPSKGDWREHFT